MSEPKRAVQWRARAGAAITDVAANATQDAHDDIPVLCHTASEIANEMVKREAERLGDEGVFADRFLVAAHARMSQHFVC